LDQGPDHETKAEFGPEDAAERLLEAVADGLPSSVELARELVAVVLREPLLKTAVELAEMLREGNPLALVRSVAFADAILRGLAGALVDQRRLAKR